MQVWQLPYACRPYVPYSRDWTTDLDQYLSQGSGVSWDLLHPLYFFVFGGLAANRGTIEHIIFHDGSRQLAWNQA